MPGGLFAIRKDFFIQLGLYNKHFKIWGGENLEISFKVTIIFFSMHHYSCMSLTDVDVWRADFAVPVFPRGPPLQIQRTLPNPQAGFSFLSLNFSNKNQVFECELQKFTLILCN